MNDDGRFKRCHLLKSAEHAVMIIDDPCSIRHFADQTGIMAAKRRKAGSRKRQTPDGHKIRVDLRKNRQVKTRQQNLTHDLMNDQESAADVEVSERVNARDDISRRRTIVGIEAAGEQLLRVVDDEHNCLRGRVTSFIGLNCRVQADDGREFECTIRGMLRSLARDSRNAVVTGDRVLFRPQGEQSQGVIERVEPRTGLLSRSSHGREHVLVANVDQVLIVASAADPEFKPQLVDRYLVTAERLQIRPLICINKIDLIDVRVLLESVRNYGRIGYQVILTSSKDGRGIEQLRSCLADRQTVVSGQSGVGKSSLLNRVDADLKLQTSDVSDWTHKGTHTTRRTRLLPLSVGGWVADTPGIRQFELWDISLEEVDGYFAEFRPFISYCRFPDCSHRHEAGCGVRDALAQQLISATRYQSYLRLREEDIFVWKNPARGTSRD